MELIRTPEEQFIIACLASELTKERGPLIPPVDLDWEKVGELLEKHRLAGHFCVFGQDHPGLFPDSLRARLKKARYGLLLYGDNAFLQVKNVLTALAASGIPVIVMKGWALIFTQYGGDQGQRFCEDIDILIHSTQNDQVDSILQGLGYSGLAEVSPGYTRRFNNARAYTLVGENRSAFRRFSIGLHWGLTHYPYYDENRINIPEIFSRAQPLKVAGVDVLEMARVDQLVYTCAHLALHHRNEETLQNYFEIAALIQSGRSEMDWAEATQRASEWGYLVQLQNLLATVHDLWPEVVPSVALDLVTSQKTTWKEHMVDRIVSRTKGNRFHSAIVEFLAMPGISNKFRSAFRQLFPSKAYMQDRYGIAPGENLFPYYFRRCLGAIRGLDLLRLATKDGPKF